jgi:putative nucleotidyltransferase with HDIG domain
VPPVPACNRDRIRQRSAQLGRQLSPQAFLALSILILTAVMGQRFYNQPLLQVDTAAPQTVVAPADATVVDELATEEARKTARSGTVPVLVIDETSTQEITQNLNRLLRQGNNLRQIAAPFPAVSTDNLSTTVQAYLRSADEADVETLWQLAREPNFTATELGTGPVPGPLQPRVENLTSRQRRVLREILTYRDRTTLSDLNALEQQVRQMRNSYSQAIAELSAALRHNSQLPYDQSLLTLSDAEWMQTHTSVRLAANRMASQGIAPGVPEDILRQAAQAQLTGILPSAAENIGINLLVNSLSPNLIEDAERTQRRAEAAAEEIDEVRVTISAEEVIVQAGEPISRNDFILLDHFNLSRRRFNWLGFIGFGLTVTGAISVFLLVESFQGVGLRHRDYLLLLLMAATPAGLLALGVPVLSLAAVGLLAGSFYGAVLGGTLIGLVALTLPIGLEISVISLATATVGALLGSVMAAQLRSREELALLGGAVGLTQAVVHLVLTLLLTPLSGLVWLGVLTTAGLQGIYGLAWSIVALGISPYLEHLFDLVTPIRLAELSNPNRPLLKRLAAEAPGTFQHTLFVATLAEAAASALGCNVELVRAGTLYHDIGKMHDPQGFIENQMGGPNKHDELDDPWLSADIIKKHVTQGLVMARKHRLPKALQDFIPEHQGTMLISYFHHAAKERAAADPTITVKDEDFRYIGPAPQSPETGIVMLADSCEAALRSLKDATPEEALQMVNKILRARWKDNQLVNSCLTREHMTVIATIFVQVWQQHNHKRIAYPKAVMSPVTPGG